VDPEQNAITDTDVLPIDTIPDAMVSVRGDVWICECDEGRMVQFDPERDEVIRTVEFAQRGFILDDKRELTQGTVGADPGRVWLLDGDAGTITPVDTATGQSGQPIGVPQGSYWHDFGGGAVWISAWTDVYRLDLETGAGDTIHLPDGVYAGGIAVDEATNSVWLANFVPSDP
jgi:sugar lactone lactonase YvrE